MEWQQLIIEPGPPGPDVLETALFALGALIGLSGVLQEQASAVEQRYQTWFDMKPSVTMDNWVLLSGTRGTK